MFCWVNPIEHTSALHAISAWEKKQKRENSVEGALQLLMNRYGKLRGLAPNDWANERTPRHLGLKNKRRRGRGLTWLCPCFPSLFRVNSIHTHIYIHINIYPFIYLHICIYLSINLSIYISIYLYLYLFIYLSIHKHIYLYIYMYIYK